MKFRPETDGIDHINVYSKGKTELGRFLSNFDGSHIINTPDGKFRSIEGYWYWLLIDESVPQRDVLRRLYGFEAKNTGRQLNGYNDWSDTEEFKTKIKVALAIKIANLRDFNKELYYSFITNYRPLTHYYVFKDKIVDVPKAKWITDELDELKNPSYLFKSLKKVNGGY